MNFCLLLSKILGSRKGPVTPTTYTVSGSIVDGGATGIEGVTVALTGDASDSTTTDSNGAYSFTGLSDGSYTVTPTKDGYVFVNASENVSVSGGNVSVDNMVGTLTYVTAGYIESGWEDGVSVPSFGVPPATDWSDESNSAVTPTNIASFELQGYTPAQSRTIKLAMVASPGREKINYYGYANDGLVFDKTKGIRIAMLWTANPTSSSVAYLYLKPSGDLNDWINVAVSNGANPDTVAINEKLDAYDDTTTQNASDTAGSTSRWFLSKLEIPANVTGNILAYGTALGTGGWSEVTCTRAVNQDWSGVNFDVITAQIQKANIGYDGYIAWIWAGTGSDDWPI